MILLKAMGLISMGATYGSVEIDKKQLTEIRPEMIAMAEAMLRGRSEPSPADWIAMFPEERAAFVDAGNSLDQERAATIGRCVLDQQYRAHLEAAGDGGESLKALEKQIGLSALGAKMDEVAEEYTKNRYVRL